MERDYLCNEGFENIIHFTRGSEESSFSFERNSMDTNTSKLRSAFSLCKPSYEFCVYLYPLFFFCFTTFAMQVFWTQTDMFDVDMMMDPWPAPGLQKIILLSFWPVCGLGIRLVESFLPFSAKTKLKQKPLKKRRTPSNNWRFQRCQELEAYGTFANISRGFG